MKKTLFTATLLAASLMAASTVQAAPQEVTMWHYFDQKQMCIRDRLIALNLLWIVCSLPVITAGASTTALYYCTLKLHKDGDIRVFHD